MTADVIEILKDSPRWRQIAQVIEDNISSGVYPVGQPLPTVLVLAEQFGVNRHTVRQALQHLQARGLLSIEQGRGTFVRPNKYDYRLGRRVRFKTSLSDASKAVTTVVAVDSEPPDGIDGLGLLPADGGAVWWFRLLRTVDGLPLSTSLHRVNARQFPDLDRRLGRINVSLSAVFADYGITDYVRLSTRILAVHPTPEEQSLLQIGPTQPVLSTRGLDGLPDGTPFHETITAFVGDRIELVFEPE